MGREEERHETYRRMAAIFIVSTVFILTFLIIRPFLIAIMSAAALSYIFYPVYRKIYDAVPARLPKDVLASLLTCLLIISIVLLPLAFITLMLVKEVREGYVFLHNVVASPSFNFNLPLQLDGNLSQLKEPLTQIAGSVIGWVQEILKAVPNLILNIFITIFSTYYFLKHAKDIYRFAHDFFPLPEGKYDRIISRFTDLSQGVILGQVVVGSLQGVLAWLGFVIVGVPNPVLWGFMTVIISTIPLLGAAMVWFPIFIFLLLQGLYTGEMWRAVVLFLYGTFVISFVDNLIKPKIVGDHAKVHPLMVLIGILGGIALFGIPGVLIGPLILTIFDVMIEILKEVI